MTWPSFISTPVDVIREMLSSLQKKLDTCSDEELPEMLADVHNLSIILEVRQHLEVLKENGSVRVSHGTEEATVTSSQVLPRGTVSKEFLEYCDQLRSMADHYGY